jgi:hypothetical protein
VDYSTRGSFLLNNNIEISGGLQYEQWRFPVITPNRQSNLTATVQLTFYPHWKITK